MFDGFLGTIVLLVVGWFVLRLNARVGRLESEVARLQRLPAADVAGLVDAALPEALQPGDVDESGAADEANVAAGSEQEPAVDGPWAAAARRRQARQDAMAETPAAEAGESAADEPVADARPDIETALGTRWAVWVGGLALALGAVFLVRYSIESGIFGPAVRLSMAALFGLVLVGAGEAIRRTGFQVPVQGLAGAWVPGILTAAGAFALFGATYAAHGIYGFIGPGLAFMLLGIIGVGAIAAALVHGQALAGLGLLGSLVTPVLVASEAPNALALFGYLAIVVAANTAIARIRDWQVTAAAGLAGGGLWGLAYLFVAVPPDPLPVLFIALVVIAAYALLWLGRRAVAEATDLVAVAAGLFPALIAVGMMATPPIAAAGGAWQGMVVIAAMVVVALARQPALALLHAAGIATFCIFLRVALSADFAVAVLDDALFFHGGQAALSRGLALLAGLGLGWLFLAAGALQTLRQVTSSPARAAAWSLWAALVPVVILATLWFAFGYTDIDWRYALAGLALTAALSALGEMAGRREEPAQAGGWPVTFALAGAAGALLVVLLAGFGTLTTTVLLGAIAVVPALATRLRTWPVLGWLAAAAAVLLVGRIAVDPTIVGAAVLGRTPVFNALLPGYGIPALAFAFAAWQLARTTAGRPLQIMQAAAVLFGLLTVAMLVRHAMNGGVIDTEAPSLGEQAIYSLIALGAGAMLIALDLRSPSPVFRIGSMAAGVVSAALVVVQHFVVLNPLLTNESTGVIPVFNLLLLGYLLPGLAAGALAWYARGRRPAWYSAMLALLGAVLVFAWATLSLRRLFQGEYIGWINGMGQVETWSYSALWLLLGVGLLVAGVGLKSQVLRIASAALIGIAVVKVFLFDMSELEGVLRALSFIGLGAVLIGIGLFYQKLLTRAAQGQERPATGRS